MAGKPTGEDIETTAKFCVARNFVPQLLAATAEWDEERNHLRMSYFFDCRTDEVDFETLEVGMAEIGAAFWSFINIGVLYVFDPLLLQTALSSSGLIFRR